jgi:hypothetical protein
LFARLVYSRAIYTVFKDTRLAIVFYPNSFFHIGTKYPILTVGNYVHKLSFQMFSGLRGWIDRLKGLADESWELSPDVFLVINKVQLVGLSMRGIAIQQRIEDFSDVSHFPYVFLIPYAIGREDGAKWTLRLASNKRAGLLTR